MPWQSAPALVIISGAFTVTGGLLMGIQYAAYGKPKFVRQDNFDYMLTQRDEVLAAAAAARGEK